MLPLIRELAGFEDARFVPLKDKLFAASFPLMKLLPARYMLEQAEARGALKPGSTICETSSGTFGLALAMLASIRGYRLLLVSDWALDKRLHQRLIDLGVEVSIVKEPAACGGLQQARLDRLKTYLDSIPDAYWPAQYDNPDNSRAYGKFVAQLISAVGCIDCLVGPVGSGGSMSGSSHYLRALFPELYAIGVDTPNSVLFGQPSGKLGLSGLGGNILPRNVDHSQFDEVHWLTPAETFRATHELHRKYGLYMGPTSGASYRVADWWSRQNPDKTVVAIFPDEGHRYTETVYDAAWQQNSLGISDPSVTGPIAVSSPREQMLKWSRFEWSRRSLSQVIGDEARS